MDGTALTLAERHRDLVEAAVTLYGPLVPGGSEDVRSTALLALYESVTHWAAERSFRMIASGAITAAVTDFVRRECEASAHDSIEDYDIITRR